MRKVEAQRKKYSQFSSAQFSGRGDLSLEKMWPETMFQTMTRPSQPDVARKFDSDLAMQSISSLWPFSFYFEDKFNIECFLQYFNQN